MKGLGRSPSTISRELNRPDVLYYRKIRKYQWFNPKVFSKRIDFNNIPEEEIAYVKNWINNKPMKILNYMTPKQVFQLLSVAIAS